MVDKKEVLVWVISFEKLQNVTHPKWWKVGKRTGARLSLSMGMVDDVRDCQRRQQCCNSQMMWTMPGLSEWNHLPASLINPTACELSGFTFLQITLNLSLVGHLSDDYILGLKNKRWPKTVSEGKALYIDKIFKVWLGFPFSKWAISQDRVSDCLPCHNNGFMM